MLTFNEIAALLDDIVDVLPPVLTKGLTGGIYLVPEPKPHPALPFPKDIVHHELRHHVEGKAGSKALEIEDANFVQAALSAGNK